MMSKKVVFEGETSSLNVIFRHETLVNIHFSVTQCDTNYLVLLLLSALFFCPSCSVNIFMFVFVMISVVCQNVSITVSPSAFSLDVVPSV